MIRKILKWLKTSHRYLHLLGGMVLGLVSNGWYMALVVGFCTAGALEYKDCMYNKRITAWDWIDFGLTVLGTAAGWLIHALIFS